MRQTPQQLGGPDRVRRTIRNIEQYVGFLPGFRRAHGRGVAFRGHFTAAAEMAAVTTAEHMRGDTVPAVVRLSNGSGTPYAADRSSVRKGSVLGLAVRFELPSGGDSEWAALSISAFPAHTPDDFMGMLSAQRKGLPTGLPNPVRIVTFLATHPQCIGGAKEIFTVTTTQSFANTRYNGLHAYWLIDADGTRRAFRYRWLPVAGPAGISPEDDRLLPRQYLISEIKLRVEREPVAWDLVFQMAEPGDPVDNMSKHWPESRPLVTAGRLVVDRLHEDQELVDASMFDPINVPPGIEPSDDPVLHFRSEIYIEAQKRRLAETKPPIKSE